MKHTWHKRLRCLLNCQPMLHHRTGRYICGQVVNALEADTGKCIYDEFRVVVGVRRQHAANCWHGISSNASYWADVVFRHACDVILPPAKRYEGIVIISINGMQVHQRSRPGPHRSGESRSGDMLQTSKEKNISQVQICRLRQDVKAKGHSTSADARHE